MAISIARILSQLRIPIPVSMGGTGSTTPDAARAALLVAGRNRVINGNAAIAQRVSIVCSNNVGGYGGPDRFVAGNLSAGGQFTQSWSTIVDDGITKNCALQTVNSSVADLATNKYWSGFNYLIEGNDCYDLKGKPVVVSFLFKASIAGTYSFALQDGSATYSYVTTFTVAANVVTKISIPLSTITNSATIPQSHLTGMKIWIGTLNNATYSTSTLNTWISGNYITTPNMTVWALTVGATIAVTELQLEVGTVATQFERIPYADELIRCQRYYETVTGTVSASHGPYIHRPYKVTKRIVPSVLVVSGSVSGANIESSTVGTFRTGGVLPSSDADFTISANAEL